MRAGRSILAFQTRESTDGSRGLLFDGVIMHFMISFLARSDLVLRMYCTYTSGSGCMHYLYDTLTFTVANSTWVVDADLHFPSYLRYLECFPSP